RTGPRRLQAAWAPARALDAVFRPGPPGPGRISRTAWPSPLRPPRRRGSSRWSGIPAGSSPGPTGAVRPVAATGPADADPAPVPAGPRNALPARYGTRSAGDWRWPVAATVRPPRARRPSTAPDRRRRASFRPRPIIPGVIARQHVAEVSRRRLEQRRSRRPAFGRRGPFPIRRLQGRDQPQQLLDRKIGRAHV